MKLNRIFSRLSSIDSIYFIRFLFSSEATCLDKAAWLEHEILQATKSEPMYKMKYMSKVITNEIKFNEF